MTEPASILLSAFADESAVSKTALEQLAALSALGLRYYSLRFIDLGAGVKNVMKLDDVEIEKLIDLNKKFDLRVATVGSPLGKVKLVDKPDGTNNAFIPFAQYLDQDVQRAIRLAHRFETKLIRGFSFYPPRGADPAPYEQQAIDQIGKIAERCAAEGVVYGLEIEANLIGNSGSSLARIYQAVNNPSMVLIFDGGNLSSQNLRPDQVFDEYLKMRDGIGWMHIKDYKIDPSLVWTGHVDEERLKNFVPCDRGDSGHEMILRDFRTILPGLTRKMQSLGAPGVFLDLEPHLKGGGQFGGYSGPDGMGVAVRALCNLLDYTGVSYELRGFDQLKR